MRELCAVTRVTARQLLSLIGLMNFHCGFHSTGSTSYAPFSVVPVSALETQSRPTVGSHSGQVISDRSLSVVAEPSQYASGSSIDVSHCNSLPVHRCVSLGLGSTSGGGDGGGRMDTRTSLQAHQLAGVESCSASPYPLSQSSVRSGCVGPIRQYDSSSIHQPAGGYSLSESVLPLVGCAAVVSASQDTPESAARSGHAEHGSGRSVQGPVSVSGECSQAVSGQPDLSALGHSTHRSVCVSGESQISCLCVSQAGTGSRILRCPSHQLAGDVGICISPNTTVGAGSDQGVTGGVRSVSYRPSVASTVLVPSTSVSISGPTVSSARALSRGEQSASQRPVPSSPSRLEAIERRFQAEGFSEAAAARMARHRRMSTSIAYDGKWKTFCSWCNERKIDSTRPTAPQLADFFSIYSMRKP